jgi:hypothetical protein
LIVVVSGRTPKVRAAVIRQRRDLLERKYSIYGILYACEELIAMPQGAAMAARIPGPAVRMAARMCSKRRYFSRAVRVGHVGESGSDSSWVAHQRLCRVCNQFLVSV